MENKKVFVAFDLDDTLYKEIDFLRSGYRTVAEFIEKKIAPSGLFEQMIQDYQERKDVLQSVVDLSHGAVSKAELLDLYRNHIPHITLNQDARFCLDSLYQRGIPMGIITDGRSITQRNKIKALGVDKWIPEKNWIISEDIGFEKPCRESYLFFEKIYPNCKYYYVGNNPKKDFKGANELGWTTICLLDSGEEIHPQNFDLEQIYLPHYKITKLQEIIEFI